MSRSLRAQVSLIFSDEDIFDNFIIPLKENKELSGMIIKLLTAYYNNEDVRNLVEGFSPDEIEFNDQIKDNISQLRQTLAMQDFLFVQAKQVLDDGTSDMEALMKVNDITKQSGVVKTEQTDSGEALVQLSLENIISNGATEQEKEVVNNNDLESRVVKIEESLANIMMMLQNGAYNNTSSAIQNTSTDDKVPDEENSSSLNTDSQVSSSTNDIREEFPVDTSEDLDLFDDTDDDFVAPPSIESTQSAGIEVTSPPDIGVSNDEDASSELNDVLKDLLG